MYSILVSRCVRGIVLDLWLNWTRFVTKLD